VQLLYSVGAATQHRPSTNIIFPFLPFFLPFRLNTTIGIYQEGSAEKAAEALKNMLSSEAILIRNGKEVKIASSQIVPGDIVVLGTGDRVPGDIRMLEVNNLACSEAALTGESVPIEKTTDLIVAANGNPAQTPLGDRTNMCFSATLVAQGYGVGVVCATGDDTEIGTINKLVNKVEKKRSAVLQQIDFVSKVSQTTNPIFNPPIGLFEKDLTPSLLVSCSPFPP
jgi:magnesium-transporting ATPase (P-type)